MYPLDRHSREQLAQLDWGGRKGAGKRGLRCQQPGEARLACELQLFEIGRQVGQDYIITRDAGYTPNMTMHIDNALQLLWNRAGHEKICDFSEIETGRLEGAVELEGARRAGGIIDRQRLPLSSADCPAKGNERAALVLCMTGRDAQIRLSPLCSHNQRRVHRLERHRSCPIWTCVVDDKDLPVHQRGFTEAENPADRLDGVLIGFPTMDDLIEDIPVPVAIAPNREGRFFDE